MPPFSKSFRYTSDFSLIRIVIVSILLFSRIGKLNISYFIRKKSISPSPEEYAEKESLTNEYKPNRKKS